MESNVAHTSDQNRRTKTRISPWPRYDEAVLGFRGYWYPAMLSRRLGRKPVALQLLGEKLLFIRHQGKCFAIEDRCAHRGVPLSIGRCEFPGTNTITCRYHGWTYNIASGLCVAALTDGPDSPIVGKARVKTYLTAERKALIWVYMGDGKPPALEDDVPERFLDPDAVMGIRVTLRKGNWRLAAENGVDPSHAAYLHRNAWLTLFRKFPAAKTNVTPQIVDQWVGYTQSAPLLEADYPWLGKWPSGEWWKRPRKGSPTKTQLRLPGYLRVDPFPAPGIIHFEWYVPVDERHHRYFQFSVKWTSGFKAWRFRVAYWFWWRWLAHVQFNGQDAWMVKLMDPFYAEEDGWQREKLYRPDVGLTAWRRHCHEQARAMQKVAPVSDETREEMF
ncbi:MAG TPA: Rieske 2Fe-2S domain-containing protein [Candidatus Binatia bacterium]|nr:Rieske 2Fe-2S domain-containing protein [Candidatus Binatia bacterium]